MVPWVSYLLEIDRKTWDAFKARLRSEGRTVKWVIERLIHHYINHGIDEPSKKEKDKKP